MKNESWGQSLFHIESPTIFENNGFAVWQTHLFFVPLCPEKKDCDYLVDNNIKLIEY